MIYLYVGIGGAIGSIFRYFVSQLSLPFWNHLPLGTLIVNLLGAFVLGWFTAKIVPIETISQAVKTGISTGVIGSFTTFSTLSVEAVQLLNQSYYGVLLVYLLISVVGGIGLSALGFYYGESSRVEVKSQ
ncbi:MAG TPA: fluoride efflux transporter CrcB [Pseudoneobacillus sp.]|nr:fluoride efflux transporter CrcB [Pseudoneobacillus sp.]